MDFTLQPGKISKPKGPLLVCVLDGYGERSRNAACAALPHAAGLLAGD